ncbi:hypothetical protein H8959_012273 [Pygathrix nigripes]
MGHQQLYWSHPRKFSQGSHSCRICSNQQSLIWKCGLNMCRQCFRQHAKDIGFIRGSGNVRSSQVLHRYQRGREAEEELAKETWEKEPVKYEENQETK